MKAHRGRHGCNMVVMTGALSREALARFPKATKEWKERTHGCWCSSWKLTDDGTWLVWRKGRWTKPKPGELRESERSEA